MGRIVTASCSIDNIVITVTDCDDNGTECDPTDDTFEFTILVEGTNTSAGFNFTDNLGTPYTAVPGTLSYGTTHSSFNAPAGVSSFTVTDDGDSSCQDTEMIAAVSCSVDDNTPPTSTCGNLTQEVTDRCPGPLGPNTPDPTVFINPNAAGILTLGFGGLPYEFDVNCVSDDVSSIENIGFAIQTSVATTNTNCLLVIEQTYDIQDECGNITEDAFTTTISFVDQDPPEITCPADAALDCGDSLDPFEMTCPEVYVDQALTGPGDFSAAATYINFDDISTPGASTDVVGNEYIALGLTMSSSGDLAISEDGAPCGTTPNSFPNALTNFNCTTSGFNAQEIQFNFGSLMNRIGFYMIGNSANITVEIQCSSNGVPVGNESIFVTQTYGFV